MDYRAWAEQAVSNLERSGPEAQEALRYIRAHHTKIGVHDQPTGARWTVARRIQVHPRYTERAPDDLYALSLIIHEVRHLQQGMLTALSVYGEMEAWQLQFRFLHSKLGRYHQDRRRDEILTQLMSLPLGPDRGVLERVRGLMKAYAGPRYRIDLLPLYPLPREISFRLGHR